MNDLLQQLVKRRHALGLSQGELSKLLNRSQTTICLWESGKQPPRYPNLVLWAEALGVELVAQSK